MCSEDSDSILLMDKSYSLLPAQCTCFIAKQRQIGKISLGSSQRKIRFWDAVCKCVHLPPDFTICITWFCEKNPHYWYYTPDWCVRIWKYPGTQSQTKISFSIRCRLLEAVLWILTIVMLSQVNYEGSALKVKGCNPHAGNQSVGVQIWTKHIPWRQLVSACSGWYYKKLFSQRTIKHCLMARRKTSNSW